MKVVICEPLQEARVAEIGSELKDLQAVVGGLIEMICPFEEDPYICLICNEEGKINGLKPCRALCHSDSGKVYDIIAGTFFICGSDDEGNFISLTDSEAGKYLNRFYNAEIFYRTENDIKVAKIQHMTPGDLSMD